MFFCNEMNKACCCVYPVIPRTPAFFFSPYETKHYRGGSCCLFLSGAFPVHIPPRLAISSSQICAYASLASPRPTTCSLLSAQTANYFSISCISDNQTSLVLYFLKHYTSHHYTVHEENSMYFNASLFHPLLA